MKAPHHHARRHRLKIGSAVDLHGEPIFTGQLRVRCDPEEKKPPMNSLITLIPAAPGAASDAPTPTAKAGDRLPQIQQTRAVGERTSQTQTFEITQQRKE